MNINSIKSRLREMLSKERLEHSINVSEVARDLALNFGCNETKAEIAGLLHDCAKDLNVKTLQSMIKEYNIKTDKLIYKIPKLLHPLVGAVIAEKKFNIHDSTILKAIRIHSTGAVNMSILDKVIYLSDKIEPLRNMEGVEEVREIAREDLNRAMLMVLDKELLYLISKGLLIHTISIKARNNILNKVVYA